MIKNYLILVLLFGAVACSSNKKTVEDAPDLEERENDEIQRDYVVRDASSKTRPGWIEDATVWAKQKSLDLKTHSYFSYETDPKVSKKTACNLAKANTKSDIAGEIATFIDKQLGESQEGRASIDENDPKTEAMREFVENTLAEKVQALIHGARISKTYWEKRRYLAEKGAARDFTAYTCATLVRMDNKRLQKAIDEAADYVNKQADDPETRDNVKKALNNASENFIKAKTGQM